MYKANYVSVLIAAAGMSNRMGGRLNKQFINLGNKPVLAHTIDKFEAHPYVDEIIIITKDDEVDYCRSNIVNKYKYKKVTKLIRGGKERQDSVYNGLLALDTRTSIIVSHDGARPFVKESMISRTIEEAYRTGAAVVGVPVTDTVKMLKDESSGRIDYTPKRSLLWAAQTPQVFRREVLTEAYEKALQDDVLGTDDSSLVERIGKKVSMIEGCYSNIKLTTKEDLKLAESLMEEYIYGEASQGIKVGD